MRYALFLLAAAIAVPAAAAAPDVPAPAAPAEQAAEQKPKKAKEKKICRQNQESTSRMGAGRLCLTAAQWAERDRTGLAGGSRSGRSAKVDD